MDFLFDLVLNNPYVPYLVGALVVLGAYRWLAARLHLRVGTGGFDLQALLSRLLGQGYAARVLDGKVARLRKAGDFLAAGRLLEEHGRSGQAVEAYAEGHEFFAAATVLEKAGQVDRAAEMYLQAGDHKKAGQILAAAGRHARAATLFLEKGNTLDAARLFAQGGEHARSAELYARGGYPLRAAQAYEKAGDWLKGAEQFEKHFMENVSYATTYASTAASPDQASALDAGRLFEKAGETARALAIYLKGGYFKEAAATCMKLGQPARAAEYFLRADDPGAAAAAWDKAGNPGQAALLRGEVALKQEKVAEAAAFFQKGGDYLRAAELYESRGLWAEAAGAYEAGGSFAAAGHVYLKAGMKVEAARRFERANELETAARLFDEAGHSTEAIALFERAGFTFRSAEAAAHGGDRERAIALLQRVGPEDDDFRRATELLGRLFVEVGRPDLAIERLHRTLGSEAPQGDNLGLHYWLAVAQDVSGQRAEALLLYRRILAEDMGFRDVQERAARLASGAVAASLTAAFRPPPAAALPMAPPPQAPAPSPTPAPDLAPAPAPTTAAPPTAAMRAGAGDRLEPKEEVGRGPLGPVFRGEDRSDGRSVALRFLSKELLRDPDLRRAVVADLKAAAAFSHPNLVKVLGLVQLQDQPCVVTELVKGHTFGEALSRGHKLTLEQAHTLARILAQALQAAHSRGLAHGCVQPTNVMVAGGVIKLADLGLGRLAVRVRRTLEYRPPGLAPGAPPEAAGDLYGLAGTVYHLLTGVDPTTQPQGAALPLPSSLARGGSEALDKFLLRALHPDPALRFATAEDVLRELKGMVRIG
jgi:tetratricopeptide (TPR) repeat protein